MRDHYPLGIYELGDKIVFLHTVLADVEKEQTKVDTVLPQYIVADFFSSDFEEHTQEYIKFSENKTLYDSCCVCEVKDNYLLLNTMFYDPMTWTSNRNNTLAKLIEIHADSINEIGESPEPHKQIYSENKTFIFGDYTVYMASEFIMESKLKSTGSVVWKLRLYAWLYTDIEEKDGVLYFGTAGHGGRFYGILLEDGRVIFNYDTGGTTWYGWHEKNVVMNDRKGDILLIDSKTGIEIRRIVVKDQRKKLYVFPDMLIKSGKIYAVARINKLPYYDFYAIHIEL